MKSVPSDRGLKPTRAASGGLGVAQLRSPKQERAIAKRVGGVATPASGALDQKGDVRVKGVLRIEAKTTTKDSFRVTKEMLRKIEKAALPNNELPAMEIEFINSKGSKIGSVCVVPTYVLEMIGAWKAKQ